MRWKAREEVIGRHGKVAGRRQEVVEEGEARGSRAFEGGMSRGGKAGRQVAGGRRVQVGDGVLCVQWRLEQVGGRSRGMPERH